MHLSLEGLFQEIGAQKRIARCIPTLGVIALLLGAPSLPASAQNASFHAARSQGGVVHLVQKGETLSSISVRFTGHPSHWRTIGRLNRIENDRTIPVGTQILIPGRLLPTKPVTASVIASVGNVLVQREHGQNLKLAVGEQVMEGDRVTTLQDSFVTLSLIDGTRITLKPETSAVFRKLRANHHLNKPTSQLFLERGRIDSSVTPASGNTRPSYEIVSPTAVSSVRGTVFRVAVDERRSLNETISGTVAVSDGMRKKQRLVGEGFGTIVESGRVSAPIKLLEVPSLKDGYQLQEKLPVEFSLLHKDAAAYHALISTDPTGTNIVQAAQATSAGGVTKVRFADLPDGNYFVQYSAASASGLHGLQGTVPFRLKARPVPPIVMQRETRVQGSQPGENVPVTLEWSQQEGISGYRLQIANDPGFSMLQVDQSVGGEISRHGVQLPEGGYYWRIASIAFTDNILDQGPFSDARRLYVLPGQAAPTIAQTVDETRFEWSAGPDQKFVFQLSDSPDFNKLIVDLNVDLPAASVSRLEPGVYYARVRSTHSDGFIGAFSPPQRFEVPLHWRSSSGTIWRTEAGPVGFAGER